MNPDDLPTPPLDAERLLADATLLSELAPVGMFSADAEGHVLHGNALWVAMLGASHLAQLVGLRWRQRIHAEELPQITEGWQDAVRLRQPFSGTFRTAPDAKGRERWIKFRVQPVDARLEPVAFVGTSVDVSEQVRLERELRQALAAADQANQAKTDFLATMSHEIRTPLNGVIGLTQLLAGAQLPPMEADSVAMIDSCAKSLLSLVDNILDISKIEAGRLTLERVPTDLEQLVREVGDVFTVRAAEKGIRFDLRQERRVPRWIVADPGRLRQILLNLLGNALKFTGEGGFSLRIDVRGSPAGPQLCCEVFDTGIGISDEDQARLFTRFTQVDTTPRRRHGGTGLGLAISQQLAQLMGGDVTLVSRKGHGSTFTLRVPLELAQAPQSVQAAAADAVRADARILLVEDNEVNQLVATRMLARLGYANVRQAFTGREAVDACSRETFDVILMDCQMPVMDGLEATALLRQRGLATPIVAFTASATSADRERCLAAGMDDYMMKPIELAVLADKMQRFLGNGQPQALVDPPSQRSHDAFDPAVIADYFMGDAGVFAQARDIFVRQTRQALQSASGADRETVRRLMHRIRGTAATLGAAWLAEVARRIEHDEAAGDGDLQAGMDVVSRAFEAFAEASAQVPVA